MHSSTVALKGEAFEKLSPFSHLFGGQGVAALNSFSAGCTFQVLKSVRKQSFDWK